MRIVGTRDIKFADLKFDVDFRSLLTLDDVKEKAESIRKNGLIHVPVIRQSDNAVLVGRKRIAALYLLGYKSYELEVAEEAEGTAGELVTIAENLHRAELTPEQKSKQRARYVAILRGQVKQASREPGEDDGEDERRDVTDIMSVTPRQSAQVSTKNDAVRKAAKDLGVTERQLHRDIATAEGKKPEKKKEPPAIATLGVKVDKKVDEECRVVRGYLLATAQMLVQAQSQLTQLEKCGYPFPNATTQRLREHIQTAHDEVKAQMPAAACPYCREKPQASCTACQGRGWVTERVLGSAPSDLLDPNRAA